MVLLKSYFYAFNVNNIIMYLVSREILFDIMRNKKPVSLSESEESNAYKAFCKKTADEYEKANSKYFDSKDFNLDEMDFFTNAMLQYMKKNVSQIRFVG